MRQQCTSDRETWSSLISLGPTPGTTLDKGENKGNLRMTCVLGRNRAERIITEDTSLFQVLTHRKGTCLSPASSKQPHQPTF